MPRVLRILNRTNVGGPVYNAFYLTKYMQPEFETLLLAGEIESHEASADYLAKGLGIDYKIVPGMGRSINPRSDVGAFRALRKHIRDFKPDVIHTHAAKPGALGRLAGILEKVPVIVHTYHGHIFHSYFNSTTTKAFLKVDRYLAKRSSAIVAISEAQKRELSQDFRIAPEEKFAVIPLGFDLDRFQADQPAKRTRFREEFGVADDEIAIGITGRLVPVKNHALFLRAIRHVLDHSSRKIKAFIIGDGESRQGIEELARALNIPFSTEKDKAHPHPLIFTSWRSDIDVINAGLDIICLTSLNEGTPVSLIEAQAANRPIVSTRVGGIGDVVAEGETGLLSAIEDEETFSNNLLQLVEDEGLRQRFSIRGHEFVHKRFSYQRLVGDMSRLYNRLLAEKSR
jgi:glycosyltransferase involved in cell wall biosynthesis